MKPTDFPSDVPVPRAYLCEGPEISAAALYRAWWERLKFLGFIDDTKPQPYVGIMRALNELERLRVAVPPETPRPDLLKFITEKRDEAAKHVRQRLDAQHSWRSGTEADHKASHKLAERMHGRKMPYMNAAQREETAAREERIGAKYQREVELYDAVIVALSVESVPPAPKRDEIEEIRIALALFPTTDVVGAVTYLRDENRELRMKLAQSSDEFKSIAAPKKEHAK